MAKNNGTEVCKVIQKFTVKKVWLYDVNKVTDESINSPSSVHIIYSRDGDFLCFYRLNSQRSYGRFVAYV